MRTMTIALLGACLLAIAPAGSALGEPGFDARVPNGDVFNCSTCHTSVPELNGFGTDFLATNPSDPVWTPALAAMDSDNDSFSNGVELLDPSGTWIIGDPDPGNPALVSNPGDESSVAIEASTWGLIKDMFKE